MNGVLRFDRVYIQGSAAVVGKKEGEGPLGQRFDRVEPDAYFGQDTWEKAETMLQREVAGRALEKAGCRETGVDIVFAGDLLNQCIASAFGLETLGFPYVGLYGACSAIAEGMLLASVFVQGSFAARALCVASSHFATSERQFRMPLEYGGQRPPSSQWTVTGAGAFVLGTEPHPLRIREGMVGRMVDGGVKDVNNMGAAMAPAAADTLLRYFEATGTAPREFRRIYTGDLGQIGSELLWQLLELEGLDIHEQHRDCGLLMFDRKAQDVHAGGSGCGCGASVLAGPILQELKDGEPGSILFMATGALMSTTSFQQGEDTLGVAHLLRIDRE